MDAAVELVKETHAAAREVLVEVLLGLGSRRAVDDDGGADEQISKRTREAGTLFALRWRTARRRPGAVA